MCMIREAVELYEAMYVMPNESSFNAIIKGLVGTEDGSYKAIGFYRKMFEFRFKLSLITLDHYSCLVDVLTLKQGMEVGRSVQRGGALLGACMNYGEVELAEITAKELWKI
ncbi:unnamed protein product [Brassica napus]|uniref:(rape) hypothetical protein n=1 Tax=Brassica napus TaxID=3708 RepID=A0A817AT06_BRANA|nr:unnamed protein product [Brassica napus]